MNRDEVFNLYKQLDKAMDCALAADKDEDATEVIISYRLASAIGLILDRIVYPEAAGDAEPAPAEIAAVDKIVLAREIRRIVGTANEHRKTMRNAWHGIGTLEHVADADRHARSGLETLENTLNYFDHKFRDLMDVIDAETDGDDNG